MGKPLAHLISSDDGTVHGLCDKEPILNVTPFGNPESIHWYDGGRNLPEPSEIETKVRRALESRPFRNKANAFIAKEGIYCHGSEGYMGIDCMFCSISDEDYVRVTSNTNSN